MEDGENGAKRLWNGYTRKKNLEFSLEATMKKMKQCLNWVEKKDGEAAIIPFCWVFQDKLIGDKLRSQNLV